MLGPCSVNLQSNFLLMGAAVFPPCYLPGGQTLVEVMKIMVTSFRISHAFTATLSASNPAAGHHQSTLPLEAPGHSRASLGQSFVGSPLLSPGSWCTRFCLCPPRFYSPVLCKFWQLSGGVNGNLLKESLCHTQICLDLGLDLIESACLINYGWRLMTLYRRQGSKPSPRKRNAKK